MSTGRAGSGGLVVSLALAASPLAQSHEIDFTAVSANVKEPGSPVRIRLNRWSTDEETKSGARGVDTRGGRGGRWSERG